MGTWGSGVLQNDAAQDGLAAAADEVRQAVGAMVDDESEDTWPRLLAATGLLVQFSPYSFEPEEEFSRVLRQAIDKHHRHMKGLTPEVERLLDEISVRREPTCEPKKFPVELERALHGHDISEFPVQMTWARMPPGCDEHEGARAFLQEFADRRIAKVEEDFAHEDVVADLCREGFAMGDFALLLIVDSIQVDPAVLERWRDAWRQGREEPDPSEAEFYSQYNACLESAFAYGIARFSKGG